MKQEGGAKRQSARPVQLRTSVQGRAKSSRPEQSHDLDCEHRVAFVLICIFVHLAYIDIVSTEDVGGRVAHPPFSFSLLIPG